MMNENMNYDREILLKKIMELDFGINDLVLFLDTHPEDRRILEKRDKYVTEYNDLKHIYEEKYGPLVANADVKDWSMWVDTSWPWERRAR